jgi:hypothetical protein
MDSTSVPLPLIEPSMADAMATIEVAEDLPKDKRRHWLCSLRVVTKALGRPSPLIPARWTAVRIPISRLHHVQMGVTAKTLANHKGTVRAALLWFAKEKDVPSRGAPLSEAWSKLSQAIPNYRTRANLSSSMRYCSALNIDPEAVDERVTDAFMTYRAASTSLKADPAARRRIARAWNSCVGVVPGWPSKRLAEPPPKASLRAPGLDEFPAGLRQDIDTYLASLAKSRRSARGRRLAPCKPKTIEVCRAKLVAFVRKAVSLGVSIDDLSSFGTLLDPDLVECVFDAYWQDNGEKPSSYLIDLAPFVLSIVRQTRCLDDTAISRLDDMRAALEQHRRVGLTEKNTQVVRQVLSSDIWRRVVNLPWQLMAEARSISDRAPVKAAGLAQLAVAIGIESVFPVRLGNLGAISIAENLTRPGGPATPYWLVFPDYDVKNRISLETVFDAELTTLTDDYIHNHLHVLLRGSNEPWLFPGLGGGHKGFATLSSQITKRIEKATGLRMTVHQFRHAAAALILKVKPGNYEYVRRVLGHRNIQTTIAFYVGLETVQATEEFGKIVRDKLRFDPDAA